MAFKKVEKLNFRTGAGVQGCSFRVQAAPNGRETFAMTLGTDVMETLKVEAGHTVNFLVDVDERLIAIERAVDGEGFKLTSVGKAAQLSFRTGPGRPTLIGEGTRGKRQPTWRKEGDRVVFPFVPGMTVNA